MLRCKGRRNVICIDLPSWGRISTIKNKLAVFHEKILIERLGKHICDVVIAVDLDEVDKTSVDIFTGTEETDGDVTSTTRNDVFLELLDRGFIIAEDRCRRKIVCRKFIVVRIQFTRAVRI